MSRRVLGSLMVMGLVLGSWSALSQSGPPGSSTPPRPPRDLLASAFQVGIVPAPQGTAGHYLLRHRAASASFSERGVDLRFSPRGQPAREVGWSLVGARAVVPQAEKPREGKLNRFVAARQEWERDVPTYAGVRYPGVLPGVDLWFEERAEGVKYGLRAERGEALRHTRLEYAGARAVRVVEEGRALEVELGEGVLREEGLRCEQEERDGSRREVGCRFADARRVTAERWQYTIEVDVEASDLPVVVDPVIVWNNYVGFATEDEFGDFARSDAGEVFITGSLDVLEPSSDVPVQGTPIGMGLLVARFASDGGLSARTLINGNAEDMSRALVLDGRKVYVAGITRSSNFAGRPINHGTLGVQDGFVARLDADSLNVEWIHLIDEGDGGTEDIHDMTLGPQGSLIVVGSTALAQQGSPVNQDLLITRIDPNASGDGGTPKWSTVIRGAKQDVAYAVAVDNQEKIHVTGMTGSITLFPSPVRRHAGPDGVMDVFLMSLNPDNGMIEKATYVGGQGEDEGRALTFMSPDTLLVGGTTRSSDLLASTSPPSLSSSAFLAVADRASLGFDETKTRVLGEGITSEGRAVAVSSEGIVYLGGVTRTPSFPLMNAFDDDFGAGGSEGFVMGVDFSRSAPLLKFSSFVGGDKEDAVLALQSDGQGHLYLGGQTTSEDLVPSGTQGQYTQSQGGSDMFLMRVDKNRDSADGGTTPDAGEAGDGGTADAGSETDGGADAGPTPLKSPLGFSCGATGPRGGAGVPALACLVVLALLTSRRRADPPRGR